jgi:membrane glycosyltransferase
VLREARRYAQAWPGKPKFADAVRDADTHERVAAATAPRGIASGDKATARRVLVSQAAANGPEALDAVQRHRLLGDALALRELRERVLAYHAHPAWWLAERRRTARPVAAQVVEAWHEGAQVAVVDP